MMTDLFAGSNTSINTSALIALANASTSAKNHSDSDESKTPETIDFATLLSQTMDSGFSVNSQNVYLLIKTSIFSLVYFLFYL